MKKVGINSNYDILKFLLSLMVVMIHSKLLPDLLYPWLRIAVPLFFIMSAYFFFLKIGNSIDENERKNELKKYVLRNLKFYLFWFFITIPITLKTREYFINRTFLKGFLILIRDFLFSGTFPASWFIMALIISTIIIYYTSKKINFKMLMFITFIIYIAVTLRSTYSFVFKNMVFLKKIVRYYKFIIKYSYNSFIVALPWTTIGMGFANKKFNFSEKINVLLFVLSGILLYIEWLFVKKLTGSINNDCYLFLLFFCISIFKIVENIKPTNLSISLFMRRFSIITYASHASVIFVLKNKLLINSSKRIFLATTIICFFITLIIDYLSKKKHFKWLKYAY